MKWLRQLFSRKVSGIEQRLGNIWRLLKRNYYTDNDYRLDVYTACISELFNKQRNKLNWTESDTEMLSLLEKEVKIVYLIKSAWFYYSTFELEKLTEGEQKFFVSYYPQTQKYSVTPSLVGKTIEEIKSILIKKKSKLPHHQQLGENDPIQYDVQLTDLPNNGVVRVPSSIDSDELQTSINIAQNKEINTTQKNVGHVQTGGNYSRVRKKKRRNKSKSKSS